jgi:hypothetical protein
VLSKACSLVAAVLGTGRAKVLEIHHAGACLFVRAGVGWGPGVVGQRSSLSCVDGSRIASGELSF